ncbi:MAG: riboflavin synthase [Pseudomonadota bacterium]|jgi:riboflavin synthase|nr:riboflavin synthase [Gammaproteobacteria bacterium]MBS56160.1 riboflavin synthase [Gammaproteobacteria bacterium]MEC8085962.1 riboflavin synthase [Pseudomonadota bacterium]MEC8170211.1 riboflavin synthase [Pseudomonadota bacterium]|tara:strand:+ start:3035 stop:3625 length:591 start_codon:yes stop_codon:yes gene_type:complete
MFSGIIEKTCNVKKLDLSSNPIRLYIDYNKHQLSLGDSVAVNGTCLTVSSIENHIVMFELSSETIEKTNLGLLTNKSMVNIELPLTLNKLISGHLVSGHIDTVVEIVSIKTDGECLNIVIQMTEAMRPFIVQKGSITVDGVSLTVNKITDSTIDLMIIPHTFKNTTMKYYKEGQTVNIELDYIAKYIVNMSNINDN